METKIWNKTFISVFFANMAFNLGQMMSNSLLAKYADSIGAPASQIGILMSMFAITALALRFIAGPAMDTYNIKYLIMGAMGVMAISYLGFSFSTKISSLMGFRLLQGCGNAFGNAACMVIVSESLPKEKFGSGIGYYSLAQVIVQAIAPTIGLYLVSWFGYHLTYMINSCIMFTAVFVASRIHVRDKEKKKLKINLRTVIAKEALLPAGIIFLLAIGFTTINSFLIVYAGKKGIDNNIGFFFTVYAFTLLFTRPLVGRLTDRYGLFFVAIPAIIFTAASFYIISQASTLPLFLFAAFVNAFGFGACQPALQSLSMKSVPRSRRGSASSTNYIGMDTGTIIGPVIAGFLAQQHGYVSMWRYLMIPVVIALVLVIFKRKEIIRIEKEFLNRDDV